MSQHPPPNGGQKKLSVKEACDITVRSVLAIINALTLQLTTHLLNGLLHPTSLHVHHLDCRATRAKHVLAILWALHLPTSVERLLTLSNLKAIHKTQKAYTQTLKLFKQTILP